MFLFERLFLCILLQYPFSVKLFFIDPKFTAIEIDITIRILIIPFLFVVINSGNVLKKAKKISII